MSSDERASGPSEIESDHGESDNEESERASSNSLFSLSSMPSLSSTPELQELNKARDDAREPTAEERNAELRQLVEEEEQRTARLEELTRVLGGGMSVHSSSSRLTPTVDVAGHACFGIAPTIFPSLSSLSFLFAGCASFYVFLFSVFIVVP